MGTATGHTGGIQGFEAAVERKAAMFAPEHVELTLVCLMAFLLCMQNDGRQ